MTDEIPCSTWPKCQASAVVTLAYPLLPEQSEHAGNWLQVVVGFGMGGHSSQLPGDVSERPHSPEAEAGLDAGIE